MKHLRKFNEMFSKSEESESREWWNDLDPDTQQELCQKYFPEKDFGALSMDEPEIEIIFNKENK